MADATPDRSPGRVTAAGEYQASRHDPIYDHLAETAEFAELRRRYRGFAFQGTIAFLVWYLLYVVMSNWATGFMGHKLIGNINVALVFGLLQFATTFALAWVYSNYSTKHLDPLARQLNAEYEKNRSNLGEDA